MDFISKNFNDFKLGMAKLTNKKIAVLLLILFSVILAFSYLVYYSSDRGRVLLYKNPLSKSDFENVKEKLEGLNAEFTIYKAKYFFVKNENLALKLRAEIGLEGILREVKGFELFDNPSFSATDFERKVNFQRAVTGNIVRHLEALDDIDKADVVISFGEELPFYRKEIENNILSASVSLLINGFSDLRENKKKLKGLRNFIARGVDRLEPENVIIIDQQTGVILTEILDNTETLEKIQLAKDQLVIKNYIRKKKIIEIKELLSGIYTEDRYELIVDVDMDWNSRSVTKKQIDPIVLKKDNPNTPYDESQVVSQVVRSSQEVKEAFKGPSFIPEGPPGSEPNVSPGARELIDRQTDYEKLTDIKNNEFSESNIVERDPPYKIQAVKIALALDGVWERVKNVDSPYGYEIDKKTGQIKRNYLEISVDKIADIKKLLEGTLNKDRGDKVEVKHIQFDRIKEFEKEDQLLLAKIKKDELLFYVMIIIPLSLIVLISMWLLYRYFRNKKRLENEFQRRMQRLKDQEQEKESLLGEDQDKMEIQEKLVNIAKERPEFVANLVKVWLIED